MCVCAGGRQLNIHCSSGVWLACVCEGTWRDTERERDRERDRERERETERETQRETERERESVCSSVSVPVLSFSEVFAKYCVRVEALRQQSSKQNTKRTKNISIDVRDKEK